MNIWKSLDRNQSGGAAYCLTLNLNNLYQGRVAKTGPAWVQAA